METLKSVGTVLLALLACGRGSGEKGKPAVESAPATKAPREIVVGSLPLELGEGGDRAPKVPVWPADGAGVLALASGTRVEKLWEPTGGPRPSTLPDGGAPAHAFWRVRVTDGPQKGLVGYARSSQVQTAR